MPQEKNQKSLSELSDRLNTRVPHPQTGADFGGDLFDLLESVENSLRMIAYYCERKGVADGVFSNADLIDRFGEEIE